jgi:hypothetical protein
VEPAKLIGAYRRALLTPEGQTILEDLRGFSKTDEPWGCALSHEEFAYRAGLQDVYKYIEALIADN